MRATVTWGVLGTILLSSAVGHAETAGSGLRGEAPDLEYFFTPEIPVDGWDAPAISNHWLWAQVASQKGRGILNMEDVRCGGQPAFSGTVIVVANGQEVCLGKKVAGWWPNKVLRQAVVDGVEYVGTVAAARESYALLDRLEMTNRTDRPCELRIELRFIENGGGHASVEQPAQRIEEGGTAICRFEPFTLQPGQSRSIRAVHLYRSDAETLTRMLAAFDEQWQASDDYWNELLTDAYTPGKGQFLSGGMPRLHTTDRRIERFYHFGVVTALMLLKRDPDCFCMSNLYMTAMPDEEYSTSCYLWDLGYASDVLAMLDPDALRTIVERFALLGPHSMLSFRYDSGERLCPGRFYASNGSMFFLAAWNYLNFTGDQAWLDKPIGDRTMLAHLREAVDWHQTRPQWNGLAHYGEEANLFDDQTVVGYHHFVAAPNAACAGIKRSLAEIYEQRYADARTATTLRSEAQTIASALLEHLYNDQGEYAGTWKQRHQDGRVLQIRHSWDFMNAGTFLAPDLSLVERQQMRDWFLGHLVRLQSDDRWVVAQDPRDGNNGIHQMEHNGRGAYPAWPYHDGWALKTLGYPQDAVALLRLIAGIPAAGAIGQGYSPDGRRCRSGWATAAGTTAASYLTRNVFDIAPGLGAFRPQPQLGDFDAQAYLQNVPVGGKLYRVTARGAEPQP
ncbi:MAG: DUF4232 domain-containing protein [Pirellulaceae bacterium]|jgi:hypothetical protein|nr:DUF4232 domain-containing protein [Pirellulaceae bacterium]